MLGRLLPDGRTLVYTRDDRGAGRLERAVVDANGVPLSSQPFFQSQDNVPNVRDFDVSADGRLIAFVAVEQGLRGDVFVSEIGNPREQWLVQESASRPRFSHDSRQLYLVRGLSDAEGRPEGQLVRVPLRVSPQIAFGPPEVVLRDRPDGPRIGSYDLAPDGHRLIMYKRVAPAAGDAVRLVLVQHPLAAVGRAR